MLYTLELGHNTMDAIENICCVKGEGTVEHSTVSRSFKKICLGYKYLDDQAMSGRSKSMDSKAVLQAKEAHPVSHTWRV